VSKKYGVIISFGIAPNSEAHKGLAISDTNFAPPTINPPVKNGYMGAFII